MNPPSLSIIGAMKVAIIGSRGRMGAMLCERFALLGASAGVRVAGADLPLTSDVLAAACAGAKVVLLCVPAAAMDETARLAAPYLEAGAVLADICSVKISPMRAMRRHYSGPVVGTHPLFGPHPAEGERSVCVALSCDGEEYAPEGVAQKVEALFQAAGCSTFRSTAEIHDRAMASIQGLNFITSVAYFAMMSRHPEALPFVTPSFRRRLEAARTLLTEDAELFSGIFEANPLSQDVVREYRSYLNMAAGGDVDMLAALAKQWFEDKKD